MIPHLPYETYYEGWIDNSEGLNRSLIKYLSSTPTRMQKEQHIGGLLSGYELAHPSLEAVKKAARRLVQETLGTPCELTHGWIMNLQPGEPIRYHSEHLHVQKAFQYLAPWPVVTYYTMGSEPITFYRNLLDPIKVPVEPGKMLLFRSDWAHSVAPVKEQRQSITLNFWPKGYPNKPGDYPSTPPCD